MKSGKFPPQNGSDWQISPESRQLRPVVILCQWLRWVGLLSPLTPPPDFFFFFFANPCGYISICYPKYAHSSSLKIQESSQKNAHTWMLILCNSLIEYAYDDFSQKHLSAWNYKWLELLVSVSFWLLGWSRCLMQEGENDKMSQKSTDPCLPWFYWLKFTTN